MNWESNLNPAQREAVFHTEGPLLILAGAGSGKTRVLTYRVGYLLGEKRVSPEGILAVTFTNKAADEMKSRAGALVGEEASRTWISTFHSVCTRILRRDIHHLGYRPGFVIYDEKDQLDLLRQILKRLGLDERSVSPKRIQWRIDQLKNRGITPEAARAEAGPGEDEVFFRVYREYQNTLRSNNALDFGDLIVQTLELFREFPAVREHYQDRWRYVLVDEYQDTNPVQYRFVREITEKHRNLCVVGDPAQSIYRWRSADITNILNFERDFPDAKVVKLEQNYRSTQTILDAARAVIRNNPSYQDLRLWTDRGEGPSMCCYRAMDDLGEARCIVEEVLRLNRSEGVPVGDCAVLYRTNAQSRVLEDELLSLKVPYTVVGGMRFYERAEIKDLLAYLRVILNPADSVSLSRIINVPPRGLGRATLAKIEERAEEEEIPFWEAIRSLTRDEKALAIVPRRKLERFIELMKRLWDAAKTTTRVSELIGEVIGETHYVDLLEEEHTIEAQNRLANIHELVNAIYDFEANAADTSLEAFLERISLVADIDTYNRSADRLSLMTLHSAKGLEFPVVFIAGLEEDVFPHVLSSEDAEELEEERRLFYVGMTRAKDRLYFTNSISRRWFNARVFNQPSRFLSELPRERLKLEGIGPWFSGEQAEASVALDSFVEQPLDEFESISRMTPASGSGQEIHKDVRVRHPVFGDGVVQEIRGEGANAKVIVEFPEEGLKTLVRRYAKLEVL